VAALPRLNEGPDIVRLSDVVHQKAIQSIDAANKAMSMARADLEKARASKEDRNKVVSRANEVAAALLAPSRQVVQLLAGHGVLFPPCKQLSKSLSVRASTSFDPPTYDLTHTTRYLFRCCQSSKLAGTGVMCALRSFISTWYVICLRSLRATASDASVKW